MKITRLEEATRPLKTGPKSRAPDASDSRPLTPTDLFGLVSCLYIGLSAALPQYTVVSIGPISVSLLLTGLIAVIGWLQGTGFARMRPYLGWAVLLGLWMIISGVAAWDVSPTYDGAISALWLVVLIPGLAAVMSRDVFRNAMILGWAGGAATYTVAACLRLIQGRSVFDTVFETSRLLGELRGPIYAVVVFILPFLLAGEGVLIKRVRWPLAAGTVWWVVVSGGRAGFLGLGVAVLVWALVQPGLARRTSRFLLVVLLGVLVLGATQAAGGRAAQSTDRLTSFLQGERTTQDDARELLLRRAWNHALDNPAFGLGQNQFLGSYHPVVEEALTPRARLLALRRTPHNTFAKMMAENGFPALVFLVGVSSVLLLGLVRNLRSKSSRAAAASLAAMLFIVFFHDAAGPTFFVPFAIALSTLAADRVPDPEEESARAPSAGGPQDV